MPFGQATGRLEDATVLRILGFVGAALVAVASWTPVAVAVPAWLAGLLLLGAAFLAVAGRADRTGARWLVTTGLLWALPLLASRPLGSRDAYAYACQGQLVTHGLDPYRVGVAALPCGWLDSVPTLWWHTPVPYGPLWLVLSGGAAAGSGGHLALAVGLLRLVALGGVALLAWAGHRLAPALGVDPRPAGWLALASPLVLVHAVSGAHNDALLAGLVLAALAVAARPVVPRQAARPGATLLAGGLLGLAVAVKVTALVAAPFVVLLVARDRRWRAVARAAPLTVVGLVAGFAAVALPSGYRLGFVPALSNTSRLVQWTSLPTGVGMTLGYLARVAGHRSLADPMLAAARVAGLVVLAAVLVGLWWWAWRQADRPRTTVLAAGLALAATTVLAPVAFPWYALTVLAVLAYGVHSGQTRYRLGLAALALALLTLPDGTGIAALTKLPGALLDTVLAAGLIVAAVRAARAALRAARAARARPGAPAAPRSPTR
jgi:alpha-1,6-mannosyltransferase